MTCRLSSVPGQSIWERYRCWSADGTYVAMHAATKASTGVSVDDLDAFVSVGSTSARVHQRAVGARPGCDKGAGSSYTNLSHEPPDHAIGRSRGGLTTKIHALADASCARVTLVLSPGQAGDNPQLEPLLELHAGQHPRAFRLLADNTYSLPLNAPRAAIQTNRAHHPGAL